MRKLIEINVFYKVKNKELEMKRNTLTTRVIDQPKCN